MARLEHNNYKSYLVGGVVRDMILGREPNDYDIATSATPGQVRSLFDRVLPTGEKHGTVTILERGLSLETTTLRREAGYSDCRRPDRVEFTRSLRQDLARRDFTINALAADLEGNVYDFFGGIRDISDGIIRSVGDPEKRFREDALRMIRAVRFACQLDFNIEKRTLDCIRANRGLIEKVSMERIREELNGILLSAHPQRGIELFGQCGLLEFILPELAEPDGGEESFAGRAGRVMDVLPNTPARLNVRLAAIIYEIAEPDRRVGTDDSGRPRRLRPGEKPEGPAEIILGRLKYDRRTVRSVSRLVKEGMSRFNHSDIKGVKRLIASVGAENLGDLFSLWRARAGSVGGPGAVEAVARLEKTAQSVINENLPVLIRDLAINGNDLKKMGVKPGREIGKILNSLLEIVLEKPEMNERSRLEEIVRGMKIRLY